MIRKHDATATRTKLLDAARDVIRTKGYAATTVDDICQQAGVTKGGFFHHFASKEQLAKAALDAFGAMASELFHAAPYTLLPDPRDRLLGYVDFRAAILGGEIAEFTCLYGTTVQETYATHPELRAAADAGMSEHIDMLVCDIEAAKALYAPDAAWSPVTVGYFIQSVLQGAFIFAKVKQGPDVVVKIPETSAPVSRDAAQRQSKLQGTIVMTSARKQKITTFLWFDNEAEEAARYYISIFKDGKITVINRYGDAGPGPKGTVMTVGFELAGQQFAAVNGGPIFKFTEAISLAIDCETQAEVDELWEKLSQGGSKGQCGWLKDKYSLSWQVVPSKLLTMLETGPAEKSDRMLKTMFTMQKLDIRQLEAAFNG